MHASELLLVEQEDSLAAVTLNRPQALNAINAAMLEEIERVVQVLAADPAIRVILITGAGDRAFAAGADIRELQRTGTASGRAFSELGQRVFRAIEQCGKPVIACLNGVAFGGGLELALACTMRLGSDRCQMGLPEARLGLIPGFGGIQRLVRQIGRSAALRIMLSAQPVAAEEALRLGILEEILPAAELITRGRELGKVIASLAPLAVRSLLSLVDQEEGLSAEEAWRLEAEQFGALCGSSDAHEGVSAFLEKRRPHWIGE